MKPVPSKDYHNVPTLARVETERNRFQVLCEDNHGNDSHECQIRLNSDGTVDIFMTRYNDTKFCSLTYEEFYDIAEKAFFPNSK